MMGVHDSTILTFAAADVLRCVNHAGNAKDWRAQWIDHKNGEDVYDWKAAHPGEDPAGSHDILDWSYWSANGYWEMHMRDRHIPGDDDAKG